MVDDKKIIEQNYEEDKAVNEAIENTMGTNPQDMSVALQLSQMLEEFLTTMSKELAEIKYFNWTLLQTFYKNEGGQIKIKTLSELLQYFGMNKDISDWIMGKQLLLNEVMKDKETNELIIDKLDNFVAEKMVFDIKEE